MNKSRTIVSSSEPLTDRGLKHRLVQNSVPPIPTAPMSNEIIHTQEHNQSSSYLSSEFIMNTENIFPHTSRKLLLGTQCRDSDTNDAPYPNIH